MVLARAARDGDLAVLQEKLDSKSNAAINLNTPMCNTEGWTLVHFACKNLRYDCIAELVKKGANLLSKNHAGKTPLDFLLEGTQPHSTSSSTSSGGSAAAVPLTPTATSQGLFLSSSLSSSVSSMDGGAAAAASSTVDSDTEEDDPIKALIGNRGNMRK